MYSKCTFDISTGDAAGKAEVAGLWLIVDGGYHRWRCLQCPVKLCRADDELALWSRWIESVRKDVRLKGSARALREETGG